eukprot:2400468-Pyramimonas_sp.AAC.1
MNQTRRLQKRSGSLVKRRKRTVPVSSPIAGLPASDWSAVRIYPGLGCADAGCGARVSRKAGAWRTAKPNMSKSGMYIYMPRRNIKLLGGAFVLVGLDTVPGID